MDSSTKLKTHPLHEHWLIIQTACVYVWERGHRVIPELLLLVSVFLFFFFYSKPQWRDTNGPGYPHACVTFSNHVDCKIPLFIISYQTFCILSIHFQRSNTFNDQNLVSLEIGWVMSLVSESGFSQHVFLILSLSLGIQIYIPSF